MCESHTQETRLLVMVGFERRDDKERMILRSSEVPQVRQILDAPCVLDVVFLL